MSKNRDSVSLQSVKNLRCNIKCASSEFQINLKYVLTKYGIDPLPTLKLKVNMN